MANIRLRLPPDPSPELTATNIADRDGICDGKCKTEWEDVVCGADDPSDTGFECTRPVGHKGYHIACTDDEHNLSKWK